jgi:hypothetical protein
MSETTVESFCFPAITRKKLAAAVDGGRLTSDGRVILRAAIERRIGIAQRLAALTPTLAGAATASTVAKIPINTLFVPATDDADITSCTIYLYADGVNCASSAASAPGRWNSPPAASAS